MKIVVLDGYTLNPGDISWEGLERMGQLTVYDRTKPEEVLPVAASVETTDDFYGPYYGDCRVPGPFAKLEEGKVYELDPRKYRK